MNKSQISNSLSLAHGVKSQIYNPPCRIRNSEFGVRNSELRTPNSELSIALFGGTFDPVHAGHLQVAKTVIEQLTIDQVWFVPAADPPHKESCMFTFQKRIEFIKEAIKDYQAFTVYENDIRSSSEFCVNTEKTEITKRNISVNSVPTPKNLCVKKNSELRTPNSELSYTIYLIQDLKRLYPDYHFSFIIGADNVVKLKTWFEYKKLLDLIEFIVIDRETPDKHEWVNLDYFTKLKFVKMPLVNVSSSEIREKIKNIVSSI